jgi:hypothetical protein
VIQGEILSRITVDTDFLQFGEEPVHNGPPTTRQVLAVAHVPVKGLEVAVDATLATVTVVPVPGQTNQFLLHVTPDPGLKPGPFKFDVDIQVVTPEGEVLPGFILPVAGKMCPEIRALPARLLLGIRPVGQTADATVVLQVPKGTVWTVDHIETSSADINVAPVNALGNDSNPMYRVSFHLTKPGDHEGTVRFLVRKGKQEPTPIVMEVSCFADSTALSPNPKAGKGRP